MYALARLIMIVGDIYCWAIIIYVLMSWLPMIQMRNNPYASRGYGYNPYTGSTQGQGQWADVLIKVYDLLAKICDPYLNLFKRLIPPIGGMVDITPIIALFVLQFIVRILVRILIML